MELKEMFNMSNKVVFITGGSGNLGRAMSEALAEYNAIVIIASRNVDNNNEYCTYLSNKYNNLNEAVHVDLKSEKSIDNCVDYILDKYKKIDVLVNNSYYGAGKEFHNMSSEEWLSGIDGSINSVFRCTKKVISSMIERNEGNIINISSMYGNVAPDISIYEGNGFYNPINYGVGKAGVVQFTKYIASVYGRYNIRCNCISPGPFPSKEVQKDKEFVNRLKAKVPMHKIGEPDDLKGITLLLASKFINGANMLVDGGWTSW
ncbi:SDR family oxidoreductase [Clostridium sp. CF012]|uniref:SDR family oxidoreductase n=1 Tax=Clostridium sp. CF012 TaxID=2843319 RepID=UPI001C0DD338|nr:SDR family oxidoreductase [Clostridium sp. CF012]MBU3142325.1 SDR family oxidoreductase [Clostridium sp. CF012]